MDFYDKAHKEAYSALCAQMGYQDCYHKALAYLLTLDEVTREHIKDVYNCNEDCIKPDGLRKEWQTGTSTNTTRLAFNLWNDFTGEGEDSSNYTPAQIFARAEYAPYYWQAIKIRFEIA